MPGLVAAPAHIGTADIQNRIRLQFAQYCIVAFPIVNLLFAVFALATGTVKPEAENISVVCCKLGQLGKQNKSSYGFPAHSVHRGDPDGER